MTTITFKLSIIPTLIFAAGACTTEETDPGAYRSTTTILNSPHANDFEVPELNLAGLPNLDDVTLVGFRDDANNAYELLAEDDELKLLDAEGNVSKTGSNLIGTRIELSDDQGGTQYIHVLGYTSAVPLWTTNLKFMTAYALAYVDPVSGRFVSICPDYHNDPYATVVTVISGERYDEATKKVHAGEADWFTLACEGQAVYKMKKLGYGPNNGASSKEERQATFRMITASYCAPTTLNSYTLQGTEILLTDKADTVDTWVAAATQLEAVWDEEGPVCWNTHRVSTIVPPCLPEPCTGSETGVWTTWLPPPAPPPPPP